MVMGEYLCLNFMKYVDSGAKKIAICKGYLENFLTKVCLSANGGDQRKHPVPRTPSDIPARFSPA